MTFNALHDAVAEVRAIVAKCYGLLTLSSIAQWEPVPQYDTLEAFTKPWLVDRATVERAIKDSAPTPPGSESWFKDVLRDPEWQGDPTGKARAEAQKVLDELAAQRSKTKEP